jgi:hypothetical protein
MSKCDCMTKVNDGLKDRNTRLASTFILTRDLGGMDCLPTLAVEKLDRSKRGRAMPVIPTFCPFCGTKYPRKGDEGDGLPEALRS